ncbi:TIGR01244 family sulfur transferase [Brevundimonas sp.]|uniref:TIGR01244 family sulfur transferase n=1 Tax=Brevundimonas sp. TaxID=1871086 RepID=UPI00378303E2
MAALRTLAPGVLVAGQIDLADLETARDLGVVRIINNRPDGEEYGQIDAATMSEAARALGLDYVHAPVRGMPGPEAIAAIDAALADGTSVLIHCKSGMRSAAAWALAASRRGDSREDIVSAAAGAGYDLSGLPL